MNISTYHIQNVIRAYGQRVGSRGLTRLNAGSRPATPDVIKISPEAKRRQITDRVAQEVVSRVKGNSDDPSSGRQVVERLNAELGGTLEVAPDDHNGTGLTFRVIDPNRGEVIKELTREDTEQLMGRLYQMMESRTSKTSESA